MTLFFTHNEKMKQLFTLILVLFAGATYAQSVLGSWKSIDDETGKARSIVDIYERKGKIYGKIIKTFPELNEDPDPVCDECDEDDPRYKKKIIGMEIIEGLEKDGSEYSGGKILDPENGNVYKCKIWVEEGKLIVRGYIGFSLMGRSQTWVKP